MHVTQVYKLVCSPRAGTDVRGAHSPCKVVRSDRLIDSSGRVASSL